MKHLFAIFTLFISSNLLANECYIRASYYGLPTSVSDSGRKTFARTTIEANSWIDCYNLAVQRAQVKPTTFSEITNEFSLLYYSWEYNDGWVNDSDGVVTVYTPLVHHAPAKGNLSESLDSAELTLGRPIR